MTQLEESKELYEWLVKQGYGPGECSLIVADVEVGENLGIALLKVHSVRYQTLKKVHEKFPLDPFTTKPWRIVDEIN